MRRDAEVHADEQQMRSCRGLMQRRGCRWQVQRGRGAEVILQLIVQVQRCQSAELQVCRY